MKRREPVNVPLAIRLYDELGTWAKVAKLLPRRSRVPFTTTAVRNAVRRADHAKQSEAA